MPRPHPLTTTFPCVRGWGLWTTLCYIFLFLHLFTSYVLYFFDQTLRQVFLSLLVLCGYYSRAAFISLETWRHQRWLDKVRTSETVMVARCYRLYAQPLSPAVSRGNNSYNKKRPSASVVTVVTKHSYTCVCVVFTSHGYYSRVATIQGWRLFKETRYSLMLTAGSLHTVLPRLISCEGNSRV